jgi:hypothetical protein
MAKIDCNDFSQTYTVTVRALESMMDSDWNAFVTKARRLGFIPEGYGKAYDDLILDMADAITDR